MAFQKNGFHTEKIDLFSAKCYHASMLKRIWKGLLELVYPPNCFLCKNFIPPTEDHTSKNVNEWSSGWDFVPSHFPSREELCPGCLKLIEYNRPPFCLKCSRFLGEDIRHPLCKECRLTKPHFDFAWGCCIYKDPLKDLIHKFKYSQKTLLRHTFLKFIRTFIADYHFDIHQFDFVVPIPLHSSRLRERGYNQSQILALGVAETFDISLSEHNLIRTRPTKPQIELSQKERWTNIRGAFRIKLPDKFKNKNILIIDDLLTTGATASEAAKTLKDAGAGTVGVLTLSVTLEK
ncbi:MAG: ComF family protein [Candidatus Omnitrophica bacterium]|nr:ComF family protein [Candidatus Omnitrophota bacterium]